ncbi:MAG: ankyrin repeat domain-containing protein [Leptospiraceae bacterium]|nr:ankyrin repeat domain-containing protein [Leptospiraceae bacterium]MBP6739463.1 ankyrin repeat domain-containing protein [Leptospiraceae bacterium]HRG46204.1 ankyrin repeat domain-containing protein [Leptospiraceae bacterium]
MRVEFLIVIEQNDTLYKTKESFIALLETNSHIKISEEKLIFNDGVDEVEINFQIETKQIQISEKQRYFHLIISEENKENIETLRKISNTIVEKVKSLKQYNGSITTLWDDISIHYATKSYPLINDIENLMRHLITKIMVIKVGMDWENKSIPNTTAKHQSKKNSKANESLEQKNQHIKETLHDFDFIKLSHILFNEFSVKDINDLDRFISKHKIDEKISVRELKKSYTKISNWDRYFSKLVDYDKDLLKGQWTELYELRNMVAHNKTVNKENYNRIEILASSIATKLKDAIEKVDNMELSPEEKVNLFLKRGGSNPLHAATASGKLDIIRFLISDNYDINAEDTNGNTSLHIACEKGHFEIVKVLIKNGANIHTKTSDYEETTLYIASENGHLDIVKLLIAKGAIINDINRYKDTALHAASSKGYLDIVEYLILNGADVNFRNDCDVEVTPLLKASVKGHLDIVKTLIASGANIDDTDSHGNTPLHVACEKGYLEIVQLLIVKGACITSKDIFENTPLHAASDQGHIEIVKSLIAAGANVNVNNRNGVTPLLAAADKNHLAIVLHLIANGANVNAKDSERLFAPCGVTALHLSSDKGYLELVKLLLENGADVNAKDDDGVTPLDYAKKNNQIEVIEILSNWK